MLKLLRRGSSRFIALSAILLTVLVCIYYTNFAGTLAGNGGRSVVGTSVIESNDLKSDRKSNEFTLELRGREDQNGAGDDVTVEPEQDSVISPETCQRVQNAETDVDTVEQFQKFNFQVLKFWISYSF